MARILIGYSRCQFSREAFARHGHEVWTCDLLPAPEGSPNHLQCDIWEVAGDRWDMGLFHPMCTYLTVSAAWAFKDGPYHQRVKAGTLVGAARREARELALENFRRLLALPYPKAIENPSPSFLSTAIRPPDQVIHPHQFGDDASKGTGLWLDRLPPLVPTRDVEPRWVCCGAVLPPGVGKYGCPNCLGERKALPRWANQTNGGQNRLTPSDDRWLERSATYPGIAAAMGDQWERSAFIFSRSGFYDG